jgi:hypothetical protein
MPPCSCYEIYGGKLFDLLNGRKKLEIREDAKRRVQVHGPPARAPSVSLLRLAQPDAAACLQQGTACLGLLEH